MKNILSFKVSLLLLLIAVTMVIFKQPVAAVLLTFLSFSISISIGASIILKESVEFFKGRVMETYRTNSKSKISKRVKTLQ
jgi:hypothetical protein